MGYILTKNSACLDGINSVVGMEATDSDDCANSCSWQSAYFKQVIGAFALCYTQILTQISACFSGINHAHVVGGRGKQLL